MKLSVIMPFFNRPEFMKLALDSFVAQQSWPEEFGVEFIAVNNNGTIPDYIYEYSRVIQNFRLIDHVPEGSDAINVGITAAAGEWITQLHDDDSLISDSIKTRLEYITMAEKLGIEVLCFGMHKMNNSGNRTGYYPSLPVSAVGMLRKELVPFAAMTWRKSIHKRIGLIFSDLKVQGDYLFKIRCAMECSCASINIPVYNYRNHPGQESVRLKGSLRAETEKVFGIVRQIYGGLG